ncbi:hypothetical protein [Methylovirgula sp. 4M-Z18]|uniref:hypothetical protein n=1 Tax=Methylovirgula sp. 4M-Z18 TaxID=2293567 RepID=UPI0011C02169|nr:hypothetical protein [Methylovirgula sp. 4M-Z18]
MDQIGAVGYSLSREGKFIKTLHAGRNVPKYRTEFNNVPVAAEFPFGSASLGREQDRFLEHA